MAPVRLLAAVVVVLGFDVWAPAQPTVPFVPPVGYRLTDAADVVEDSVDIPTGPLDRERVTGLRWQVVYEAVPGARQRPIEIARHYLHQVDAKGGTRLFGYMADQGGEVTARVPGDKPLWLRIAPGNDGDAIELTVVQEASASPRTLVVPAERLEGRWASDRVDVAVFPAGMRPALQGMYAEVSALLRAVPLLAKPVGAVWMLLVATTNDPPASGPVPLELAANVLLRTRACDTCPVQDASEGRRMITVTVNDPLAAVVPTQVHDAAGREMYEWRPAQVTSPVLTRTTNGHLVLTRPGRPPLWLPVTREGYLRAQIAEFEKTGTAGLDLAKAKADQDQALRDLEKINPQAAREARAAIAAMGSPSELRTNPAVAMLTEELAALSDDDRRKSATLADGAAIVTLNPAYEDKALPRTAAQMVVVTFASPQDYFLFDLVDRLKPLDWSGFAKVFR